MSTAGKALLALVFPLLACSNGTEPTASSARFDGFWSAFDREYPYFIYKEIDWNAARALYRDRAAAAMTDDELVSILGEMVAPLRDQHVVFIRPDGVRIPTYTPEAPVNWDQAAWSSRVNGLGWQQLRPNFGYLRSGSIGYIAIGAWNPAHFSAADFDATLEILRDCDRLIIDVRANGGGDDALAYQVAGRFAAAAVITEYFRFRSGPAHNDLGPLQERRLTPRGSWQFTKPVAVLIGRRSVSSNESFVLAMGELPQVTLVGDTTGGASGNPSTWTLGDGWSYTVPHWIAYDARHRVVEWNGIAPDVVVPWSPEVLRAGTDETFDFAWQWAGQASFTELAGLLSESSAPGLERRRSTRR